MSAIAERLPNTAKSRIPRPRPSPDGDPPRYDLRMSKQGAEAFGTYLAKFIARSGRFPDATTFARAANVSPSAVSRWINGKDRPSVGTLEKIAPHMRVTVAELVAIAYPENNGNGPAPEPAATDPLIDELAAMLDPGSPLEDSDRAALRDLLGRIAEPHRKQMRRRRPA